jgi:hypothetical protein
MRLQMSQIVGNERQVVVQSRCGNQKVQIADELTLGAQLTTHASKLLHDALIEGEYVNDL